MSIFSRITAKTMSQNRTRTIVTVIGVILSAAMIMAVVTFGVSFQRFLIDYSISRDGNWHLAALGVSAETAEKLENHGEVELSATVTELGYALFEPVQEQSPSIPYLYVQSLSKEALELLPVGLSEGRLPESADEVIVPDYLIANEAEDQITEIGDVLTLELGERLYEGERLTQNIGYMNEPGEEESFVPRTVRSFQVVGIYNSWPNTVWGSAGYEVLAGPQEAGESESAGSVLTTESGKEEKSGKAQTAKAENGQSVSETAQSEAAGEAAQVYQDLYLTLKHPRRVYQFANENLPDASVVFNGSLLRWLGVVDNDNFYKVMGGLMTILMLIIVTGSVTLIYNAFSISLRERTTQFGLLSSIGATKKQLRRSMRYEALLVSAVGIPLGILAGIGGSGITLHYIGKTLTNWIHGVETGIPLIVSPGAIAAAAVIALVTVMISVWIPSRRIRKISPLEAIRANTDIKIRPKEVRTGRWVFRFFGLEGMLAEKNYKRDRKKYRATVVSLTMSIVLFMAAALFNLYLTKTGAFVLDAPETDLEYEVYGSASSWQMQKLRELISQDQDVSSVLCFGSRYLVLQIPTDWLSENYLEMGPFSGDAGEEGKTLVEMNLTILPDDVFASYAETCGVDPSAYEGADQLKLLYLNEMKLYNSQTQRYERINVFKDTAEDLVKAGCLIYGEDTARFELFGELELGAAVGQTPEQTESNAYNLNAFASETMFEKLENAADGISTIISIQSEDPDQSYERIKNALEKNDLDIGYLQNLSAEYESDRNTLMAVNVLTYGFIALISLIAVANVFNTISTNLMLRRREFAMLRSMGMSPKGLQRMMNYECLIYGIRAIFYGVILSVLLGAALQRVIGTGADVGFLIPWNYLGLAVLGIFAVVFVTMLYTMRKIKKNNIVEELKMN